VPERLRRLPVLTEAGLHNHRLVCRSCDAVVDVPCPVGGACAVPSDTAGYAVEAAEIVHRGVCPGCRAAG
jgi:Fur family transcriptional regulator, stress-responsive regulator